MLEHPLNLLVVGVRWPPETFIQRKLEGLAAQGIVVTVASSVPWRKAKPFLNRVSVRRLHHSDDPRLLSALRLGWSALTLLFRSPTQLFKVFRVVRSQHLPFKSALAKLRSYLPLVLMRADVVHFEWNSAAVAYLPLYDVWKSPIVISCRGEQINVRPHIQGNDNLTHEISRTFVKATAVHCVSKAIAQEAVNCGLDLAKSVVIRPAVNAQFFRPAERRIGDNIFRLISIGSLIWRKGYEYALLAVRLLIDEGVPIHLGIVGDGPEQQRLRYTIRDLDLESQVKFYGPATPGEVLVLLQKADAFLLSSVSEGISNAVLEAMACGLPVVTSDCGGMREAIRNDVEGFVVPIRDPDAMAKAVKTLFADTQLRERMGRAARQRALSNFSHEKQIAKWVDLYRSIAHVESAE